MSNHGAVFKKLDGVSRGKGVTNKKKKKKEVSFFNKRKLLLFWEICAVIDWKVINFRMVRGTPLRWTT